MPGQAIRELTFDSMINRNIQIGNLIYSISSRNGMWMNVLERFFTSADCGTQNADCSMEIETYESRSVKQRSQIMDNRLFDADRTWGIYDRQSKDKNSGFVMTVPSLNDRSRSKIYAEFDSDFKNGTVYARKEEEHYLFYPFLEVLTINLLARNRGALLHASCIDDNGTGYLFLGQSGAGKSTMANIWNEEKGISVLSDDRVLVSLSDKGLNAYGTPWHGTESYAVNACVPVKKIFFIRHAEKTSALKISGIKAASELVRNAFLPFWDKNSMEYSTEFLIQASLNAELFSLDVYPDRKIIDLVRNI